MSKTYRVCVLGRLDNGDDTMASVKDTIKKNGGRVIASKNEGEKRLAYRIMGEGRAIYNELVVEWEELEGVNECHDVWCREHNVIRFMTTILDADEVGDIIKRLRGDE